MESDDWYCGSDWDDEAQELFRRKLSRSKNQRDFYLRTKAAAISESHPVAAIELLDEYIATDESHVSGGNYSKSMIHLSQGDIDAAFASLGKAVGDTGMNLGAVGVMEFAFLSGLHKRSQNYEKALERLEALDQDAQKQVGRSFARSFAGHAGCAFILYDKGQRDEAIAPAKAALELAVTKDGPISTHPNLGRIPKLPDELLNRLIVIAGLWDEGELGTEPKV